jgi:hypothetical protein
MGSTTVSETVRHGDAVSDAGLLLDIFVMTYLDGGNKTFAIDDRPAVFLFEKAIDLFAAANLPVESCAYMADVDSLTEIVNKIQADTKGNLKKTLKTSLAAMQSVLELCGFNATTVEDVFSAIGTIKRNARLAAATASVAPVASTVPLVTQAPIDLPEQVLVMIVSRVRDVRPPTAEAEARSLCADVMHGIGSVSRLWRRLAKGVLMGDELAWLRVPGAAAAAECMASFPRALSLCIDGGARAGDIGAVLGSRPVMRLEIANNHMMRDCEGLGQLVGLRALYIAACDRLRDVAALASLDDLRTLQVTACQLRAGSLASSLASMAQLTSLNLCGNDVGAAGAAALAPSLALMTRLTSLDLGYNWFGAAGAVSLAPSLALMAQLTSLDLEINYIREAGAASLAPSLAVMSQLTSLNLGHNSIGAAGAASLAPSLAVMSQLTSLNLGHNSIGAAGAASLAPSLALMAQLTSLDLNGNSLGDAGAASLAPSLAAMARLTSLDLGGTLRASAGLAL